MTMAFIVSCLAKNPVDFGEEIGRELMSVAELIGNALVADISVPVIVGNPTPCIAEFLRDSDRMRVVVPKNSFPVWRMQR